MINKAIELIQEGSFEQAEEILLAELEHNPDSVQVRVSLALSQLSQSDFAGVEQTLLPALQIDPVNIQALVFMGAALLEQGKAGEAIKYLQRVTRRHSDNVEAQFCLARAYLAEGRAPFAEPCLQKAIKVEPDNSELRDWLGRVQLRLNRIDDAKQNFDLARQSGQSNAGMLKDAARVETILGNIDEAMALTAQAVELAPEDHDLAFLYADMLIEQQQYELGSAQLERLRLANYQVDRVGALLANSYARQGQQGKALGLLAELQRKIDIPPTVRHLLSLALRLCDQPSTADEHLEILLAMDPPWIDSVLVRAKQLYETNDQKGLDMLTALLKRKDINSWQIHQAKLLLAFALEKAGYEPINPPKREPQSFTGAPSQNLSPGPRTGWNPADLSNPSVIPKPVPVTHGELAVSAMEKKVTDAWPKQPPDDEYGQPVFVFAWPGSRSEQLLGSLAQNPGLVYLPHDEANQGKRRERLADRLGADQLESLSSEQITLSRRLYWRAAGGASALLENVVLVDLQRLGAEMLPTISRYFPAAPVIVLTRDPRDMAVFWKHADLPDLENFATLYANQIQQLQLCQQILPLNFVNVDFDELCANPELELERIQRSIGVEPDAEVLNKFQHTIEEFPPNSGDWKNHESVMASIFAKFK